MDRQGAAKKETSDISVSVLSVYAPTARATPGVKAKFSMTCKILLTESLQVTS